MVVGLSAEARIAARLGWPVRIGGGTPEGAADAANWLLDHGASSLISFGLAGGLDPGLRPGSVVVPRRVLHQGQSFATDANLSERFGGYCDPTDLGHTVLAASAIVTLAQEKRALRADTGAHAVDLESGSVARAAGARRVPFAVVRAICDPAERDLPPAALVALNAQGVIAIANVLASVLRQPRQIAGLLQLAHDAAAARKGLIHVCEDRSGPQPASRSSR